ncbi:FAD-dependent oxidoreductase [Thalassotalea ponticola]|uniref:NAD(P)/FAD-dependent oxidoreductase n=1 Tax=Thalassotalea ponticola TaxID=1523392 RepID=UPI0025B5840B|nr:FAD-dependent oxidoreductase [Thalassotalea ponticola]MDN3652036.1 FAD-dependent oxidoreductase [Thalassotalea ponticola]
MYDPLIEQAIASGQGYPDSYWASVSGEPPVSKDRLTEDLDTDVVIIGAGYTGMSCALHLQRDFNITPVVIEANQTAWGCSGRNAGFILKSTGRKSWTQMQKHWGDPVMRMVYQEAVEGVERVHGFINEGIDCDVQQPGYIRIAHKPNKMRELEAQASLLSSMFGYHVDILSRTQVHQQYMNDENAHGAIRFEDGVGINPLKLAFGYHDLLNKAGVDVYTNTPAVSIEQYGNRYRVITEHANISCDKVVIATNGYTPKGFDSSVANKTLPVLSQIIVTEPLTEAQLQACNFITSNVVMDTRALKYYYRKLPDNRILFGGRGAITGKSADDPYYAERLLQELKRSFPPLADVRYQYRWSGWICMSLDDIPHIAQAEGSKGIFYAMGYCGNGVSFAVQAGKRLADKVAGRAVPDIPLYNRQLVPFPMPAFRRIGQWAYFHYGKFADQFL